MSSEKVAMWKSDLEPPSFNEKSQSEKHDPTPQFRTAYACMSLHMSDKIRFLNFPAADTTHIRAIVQRHWPRGIQRDQRYGGAVEIKLYGTPWGYNQYSNYDGIQLMRHIFEVLFDLGWVLHASVDICKKQYEKDSLIFRRQDPPPPKCAWLSISLEKGDKLTVHNGTSEIHRGLAREFGALVQRTEGATIKFRGYPWQANGEATMTSRTLLLKLLSCLETFGYSLYSSIEQQDGNGENTTAADVMVFNKDLNWIPGAPVFHR